MQWPLNLQVLITSGCSVWLEEIVDQLPGYQGVPGATVGRIACCAHQLPDLIICLRGLLLIRLLDQVLQDLILYLEAMQLGLGCGGPRLRCLGFRLRCRRLLLCSLAPPFRCLCPLLMFSVMAYHRSLSFQSAQITICVLGVSVHAPA